MAPSGAYLLRVDAIKQLGKRYIFGYEVKMSDPNPKAFDCSELIQWLFHRRGYRVPDGSFNQYPKTIALPKGTKLRHGDLFFLKNGRGTVYHVGIYVGAGQWVEARGRAYGVVKTNTAALRARGAIFRRFVTDLDGKHIDLQWGKLNDEAYYWVLVFAPGIKANKIKKLAQDNKLTFRAVQTDRAAAIRADAVASKLKGL